MSNFVPQTEIVLCNHVPFDRSYEKTVLFDTKQEQQAFFNNRKVLEIPKNTYQRMSWSSFKVQAKADDLREKGVNYCYWKNGNYSKKYYYAFVTSIEYVNPNTAIIYYELDDMQTYMFDIKYRDSYIQRKHYDLGTRDDEGNLTGFTCPYEVENLNYGDSYRVIDRKNLIQIPDVSFMIFGTTLDTWGTLEYCRLPLNLSYIILPCYVGKDTSNIGFQLNGYSLTLASLMIENFRSNASLVGKLVSLNIVPFLPIDDLKYEVITSGSNNTINLITDKLTYGNVGDYKFLIFNEESLGRGVFSDSVNHFKAFPKFSEQKLYMSPYSFNLLSTDRGSDFIIKNEYCTDEKISVSMYGTLSTTNKSMYVVDNYNGSNSNNLMDNAIIDESNSNLPIIDDYTASYIQSNANAIQVARSNAMLQYNTSYVNTTRTFNYNEATVNTAKQQATNTRNTANQNTIVSLIGNSISGLAGALDSKTIVGGVGTAIAGVASAATNAITSANTTNTTYQNAMLEATNNTLGNETTRLNALATAMTDYQATIGNLNAKYQDALAIADTARSLGNDYIFNVANKHDGIYLYKKTIRNEWILKLTNYFKMYGYLANEMGSVTQAMNSRKLYNYVKLTQCNITGDMPQDKIMSIKNIFMNGITFYHSLTMLSGQESDYACDYPNIAYSYDDCMFNKETNKATTTTNVVSIGGGAYDSEVSYNIKGAYNVNNGDTITLNAKVNDSYVDKYKFKGWLGLRLGTLYEGNEVTLHIYHDETFYPVLEQIS